MESIQKFDENIKSNYSGIISLASKIFYDYRFQLEIHNSHLLPKDVLRTKLSEYLQCNYVTPCLNDKKLKYFNFEIDENDLKLLILELRQDDKFYGIKFLYDFSKLAQYAVRIQLKKDNDYSEPTLINIFK